MIKCSVIYPSKYNELLWATSSAKFRRCGDYRTETFEITQMVIENDLPILSTLL